MRAIARCLAALLLAATALWACSPSSSGIPGAHDDGGAGQNGKKDGGKDAAGGGRPDASCTTAKPDKLKAMGEACSCSNECTSGQCVDGVCCSSACTQTCFACNVPGKLGTCSPVPSGQAPAVAGQCAKEDAASCGLSGMCDGAGKCAKYPDGTVCQPGKCDSGDVVGAKQCNAGKCELGERIICAPYVCDSAAGMCFNKCSGNQMCATGRTCESQSCGKRPLGATCEVAADCESNFCADGVCCNQACNGMCQTCNQVGKMGECSPVPSGNADPHNVCKDEGASSCGFAGVCNGKGGCTKYAAGTICKTASCSGGMLIPASVCDGSGACSGGSAIECAPYACGGTTCTSPCVTNEDCQAPAVCVNGSCGPKPPGVACKNGSECASKNCVDGVCCNEACTGLCQYCNSPSQPGKCVNVANGAADPRAAAGITDPTRACVDQGMSSCGRNGLCNGNGGCQLYPAGVMCKGESCNASTNTHIGVSTCNGSGMCVTPPGSTCAPFTCNGNRCYTTCSSNMQCSGSNTCQKSSCGLLPNGAVCSSGAQCSSNTCAQGVCCSTACNGSCFSCNLPGTAGTCKPVPAGGVDPTGTCKDAGSASCGNDGTCNGSGACRKYAAGTLCVAASCSNGTFKAKSTCDGAGSCKAGATRTCNPYVCNPAGTDCYSVCSNNNACAAPNTCNNSSCGKAPDGATCGSDAECTNGHCVAVGNGEKVCCATACTGTCMTCATGACKAVGNGEVDPQGRCMPDTAGCGNDGFCNGAGACRLQPATKTCGTAACPAGANAGTAAPLCDGKGKCSAAVAFSCGTFKCNPDTASCYTMCTTSAQCAGGNACTDINGQQTCGLKDAGASCQNNAECKTGKCIDGVCCNLASGTSCGACKACNVAGHAGACFMVDDGTVDPTCNGGGTACGTTNTCAGGACGKVAAGTGCGSTCAGGLNVTKVCDGAGACVNGTAPGTTCPGNLKCTGTACPTTCTVDTDCVDGYACAMPYMASGAKSCRKLMSAEGCSSAGTCTTGFCANGVCCNNACTGDACKACNLAGSEGTCTTDIVKCPPLLGLGAACTSNAKCMSGKCVDGVCCGVASCGSCQTCNGTSPGTCTSVVNAADNDTCPDNGECGTVGCNAQGACMTVTCAAACSADGLSAVPKTCAQNGTCQAGTEQSCGKYKCSGGACLTTCGGDGDCAPGYFCTGGQCAKKANGTGCTADDQCASSTCAGNVCCSTACGATCSNDGMSAIAASCATGTCVTGATTACGKYRCKSGACPTSCAVPSDCASGFTCTNGACVDEKRANGEMCTVPGDCMSSKCVGGTCCASASCPDACSGDGLSKVPGTCSTGTCGGGTPQSCGNYTCSNGACLTTCTVPTQGTDCAPGLVCDVSNPVAPVCVMPMSMMP